MPLHLMCPIVLSVNVATYNLCSTGTSPTYPVRLLFCKHGKVSGTGPDHFVVKLYLAPLLLGCLHVDCEAVLGLPCHSGLKDNPEAEVQDVVPSLQWQFPCISFVQRHTHRV